MYVTLKAATSHELNGGRLLKKLYNRRVYLMVVTALATTGRKYHDFRNAVNAYEVWILN